MTHIPFNRPALTGREVDYILEAVENMHVSGDGPFTRRCQALLQRELEVQKVLLTTSCTDALEMAALLLRFSRGDEVIVPSFAFVSTVNAFVLHGATPRFADVRPDTLNIDESQLDGLITDRTRAIVPVHYAGVACEMDSILDIASRHGVAVIEDNAHGLFARYKGRSLGTFGVFATLSFHETKNFTCGEGGAFVINDARYVERAEIVRDKGTNRSRFYRGQVDRYTWVDVGSSYLPSDILAAYLYAQLEAREKIQSWRRQAWQIYFEQLSEWATSRGVGIPVVPPYCDQSYHMFYLIMPSLEDRRAMMAHLDERGVSTVFHYQPLHLSEMGRSFGGRRGQCPVTERIADRLLRLPLFNGLTEDQQLAVVGALQQFRGWRKERAAAQEM